MAEDTRETQDQWEVRGVGMGLDDTRCQPGWEPFSVTVGLDGWTLWLRRRRVGGPAKERAEEEEVRGEAEGTGQRFASAFKLIYELAERVEGLEQSARSFANAESVALRCLGLERELEELKRRKV